jgi:hypothetical protein
MPELKYRRVLHRDWCHCNWDDMVFYFKKKSANGLGDEILYSRSNKKQ